MAEKRDMVQIDSLEKYFGEDKERVHVLKGVSLNIPEGSLYTFLGPSGCGKTTTLRCVAGLERPDGGRISIGGHTVFAFGERVYVPTNKRPIGMVFQSYAIWPHMTVAENVAYPLTIQRRSKDEIRRRVGEVLKVVGLDGLEDRPAPKLSGGQQQRVAFARALINEPKVMLLDEPLSNLDARLRVQMRSEIKSLQRRTSITTIFVTHDQAEALAISDQIAVMHGGETDRGWRASSALRPSDKALHCDILGADQPNRRQSIGGGRGFQARQDADEKRHPQLHPGTGPQKRPSSGDFDPARKYPGAQRKAAISRQCYRGNGQRSDFHGRRLSLQNRGRR